MVLTAFIVFRTFAESRAVDITVLKILHILLRCENTLEIIEISLTLGLTELLFALDVLCLLLEFLVAKLLHLCLLVSCQIQAGERIHHARIRILQVGARSIAVIARAARGSARCSTRGSRAASIGGRLGESRS